jgi:hypothetical protein
MSKYDSKPVTYAVMHTVEHTPQTGQFGPTLSAIGDSRLKGTPMRISEPWIEVHVPAAKDPSKIIKVLIPITNFKHVVIE